MTLMLASAIASAASVPARASLMKFANRRVAGVDLLTATQSPYETWLFGTSKQVRTNVLRA
jgi:hypothetical protein